MARSLIEERYTWPVRAVLLGGGSLRATSYQIEWSSWPPPGGDKRLMGGRRSFFATWREKSAMRSSAKRILICIDGTGNDPHDAVEHYDESGLLEDDSISNVLKLHILAGGTLDNQSSRPDQHSFYYIGVGNRGATAIYRKASAAFAITEPHRILKKAYEDLSTNYSAEDSIFIFGFSRGAAIARWLAQRISEEGLVRDKTVVAEGVEIALLGVWDTVAAFGGVNLDKEEQPTSREVKENGGRIAPNVHKAFHLVSIDDPRRAFRPVLMGQEQRVQEVWFAGVHSDVGGGYRNDALSDITLRFMIEKARAAGVNFRMPDETDYSQFAPITARDLEIEPDATGRLHLKSVIDDKAYIAWLQKRQWKDIMAPRKIYVAAGDAVTRNPPLIHHTVFDRRERVASYNPPNLMELGNNYRILAADGSIKEP